MQLSAKAAQMGGEWDVGCDDIFHVAQQKLDIWFAVLMVT